MSDGTPAAGATQQRSSTVHIPLSVRDAFGELIELILASESMNDEERQYWVDILPVMSPDQTSQLAEILRNERNQLAEIDRKYAEDTGALQERKTADATGRERKERREARLSREQEVRAEEQNAAADILENID